MTNDLKNFLEKKYKEQEAQYETSTFINWLKESDKELVNFVLDLVEKEVEKYSIEMQGGNPLPTESESTAKDILTIINQLRVK